MEVNSPILPTRNVLKDFELQRMSSSPIKSMLPNTNFNFKLYEARQESEELSDKTMDEEEKKEDEVERAMKEKIRLENLNNELEEWLRKSDDGIIYEGNQIYENLSKMETLEMLLVFVMDPLKKIIDPSV